MKISAKNFSVVSILIFASILPFGCSQKNLPATSKNPLRFKMKQISTFTITSSAFSNNSALPSRFTCGGAGVSPPLTLSNLPKKTKTVAFILEDPDAPKGTYTHWVMWNWPVSKTAIPAAIPPKDVVPSGAIEGTGSNGEVEYNPPCPPSGMHRYYFKAYALDSKLSLPSSSNKQTLLTAMQGHIIGQGMLMGTYHK